MKLKSEIIFFMFVSSGLTVSFFHCFGTKARLIPPVLLLIAFITTVVVSFFSPDWRKKMFDFSLKMQPLAAVVFCVAFILSFSKVPMVLPMLFVTLVLNTMCLCRCFENKTRLSTSAFYSCCLAGAVLGGTFSCFIPATSGFIFFVLAGLLCRPCERNRTFEEIWKDIALPLFVLLCSFALFLTTKHSENFPDIIAESIVMVMIGIFLMPSKVSGLRLMLLTVVLMIFGSYVFSLKNPASVFHQQFRTLLTSNYKAM